MKLGIIGSRTLTIDNLEDYIPGGVTEIISGGAKGIDTCAQKYADEHGIKMTVVLPNYKRFGKAAPVLRNSDIVSNCDRVIAFWDGASKGTYGALKLCRDMNIPYDIYLDFGEGAEEITGVRRYHLPPYAEELFFDKSTPIMRALSQKLYEDLKNNDN